MSQEVYLGNPNLKKANTPIEFTEDQIVENARTLISALMRAKPPASKGTYLKKVSISSTMGPGIKLDKSHILQEGGE